MKYTSLFVFIYFINQIWLVDVLASTQPKVNLDLVYNRPTRC
jgi:hypothetical protein